MGIALNDVTLRSRCTRYVAPPAPLHATSARRAVASRRRPTTAAVNAALTPSLSTPHRPRYVAAPKTKCSSPFFGRPTAPPSPAGRQSPRLYISACAYRRGNTLVVAATLAGAPDSTTASSSSSSSPAAVGSPAAMARVQELLQRPIRSEDKLVVGQLDNGLQYVILPNHLPPTRFEAHLEVHAGSVDELEHEQGVAHLVEHVTFLGSKKREGLIGTGARANAYTDFHHTVFHVHAPLLNSLTNGPMLPQVLDALVEVAFQPQFLPARIEKERKAVLAEAQMMNTIEYRVDCQLLTYLHEENYLGCRFPIGKTEQVKTWEHGVLRSFWDKWYFPANATLYVVGDIGDGRDDVEQVRALIARTFGRVPPGVYKSAAAADGATTAAAAAKGGVPPPSSSPAASAMAAILGKAMSSVASTSNIVPVAPGALKQRHAVRPPVVHRFGHGPLPSPAEPPADVRIFRHPLLQHYMLSVFCKLPIRPVSVMADLKNLFLLRIVLSVFQFRVNARYVDPNPCFLGIELDISDSAREGCAVSTLTITAEPRDWADATRVAVQEIRRLQRHGLTPGEFARYKQAILRDSAQLAEQANKIPSLDTLNFVMENLASGHTVMGHRDAHEAMVQVAETATLDEVNALAASMLTFASDYGREGALLAEAEAQPHRFAPPGPTRATKVIACIPAFMDESGQSIVAGSDVGGGKRASLSGGAAGHIDADEVDLAALEAESAQLDEIEIPEGAIKFDLSPAEIAAVLSDDSLDVSATDDVELPEHLISEEAVDALVAERRPAYVPLQLRGGPGASNPTAPADPSTGITQRQLSNGVRLNYRQTDNEPKAALLRLIASGGRAAERLDKLGAVVVGARTLSESGTVAGWKREQVEVFCVANLINCALESDEENVVMDFHFAVGDGGMQAVFELLHLFLEAPRWEEGAMERAKQAFSSSVKSVGKSLERASADRIMSAMLGPDRRFRDPSPEEVDSLELGFMRDTIMGLLHPGNIEVNVVGDFDAAELEDLALRFLGTLAPQLAPPALPTVSLSFCAPPVDTRHQRWHLRDSDERAVAYIAGPAPCRWGGFGSTGPLPPLTAPVLPPVVPGPLATADERTAATARRRSHPLYASVTLMLLTEIVNSRLFTTVRDALGLTYDVSFEVTMFDRIRSGWFSVHVTSHPDNIYDALNASLAVLREFRTSSVTQRELQRAKTTILTRHESDLKDNVYWLALLTHLQNGHVPHKNVECLRDLRAMYEAAAVDDIYDAYNCFDFSSDAVFTCVGTSGKAPPAVPEAMLTQLTYLDTDRQYADDGDDGDGDAEQWAQQQQQQQQGAGPSAQAGGAQQQQAAAAAGAAAQKNSDVGALFAAMMAATGGMFPQGGKQQGQPSKDNAREGQQ